MIGVVSEQMVREYVEEIAELKHLVIRLEEEVNQYEKRERAVGVSNRGLAVSMRREFVPTSKGESRVREGELREYD